MNYLKNKSIILCGDSYKHLVALYVYFYAILTSVHTCYFNKNARVLSIFFLCFILIVSINISFADEPINTSANNVNVMDVIY
jgi:hypothetical protein